MEKKLTFKQIVMLQKAYGVTDTQNEINSGMCWLMEGSVGRFASDMLEAGVCMLPTKRYSDYYGNTVPSRNDLKAGTKGTFQNSVKFWTKVYNGDYEAEEQLQQTFGYINCEEEVA